MNEFRKILTVETKLLLRDPTSWLVAIILPSAVLLIVGLVFAPHRPDPALGGLRFIDIFVPSMIVITLATLGLQTLPIRMATYREKGVLRRLSTTPMHPARLLAAQLLIYMVTAVIALALLVVVGHVAFAIPLPLDPIGYVAAFLLGMSSLFALGLLIAALAPTARAGTAFGLPLFFAAMFLGGVYLPRWLLPDTVVAIGEFVPPGVEGLQDAWLGLTVNLVPLALMAAITVAIGAVAVRSFRWE
jgi:ABC-2 type transport system permease protein